MSWYQNPCNLAAALLIPVYMIYFVLAPFSLFPESLIAYVPMMMILARFYRRKSLDRPSRPYRKVIVIKNDSDH